MQSGPSKHITAFIIRMSVEIPLLLQCADKDLLKPNPSFWLQPSLTADTDRWRDSVGGLTRVDMKQKEGWFNKDCPFSKWFCLSRLTWSINAHTLYPHDHLQLFPNTKCHFPSRWAACIHTATIYGVMVIVFLLAQRNSNVLFCMSNDIMKAKSGEATKIALVAPCRTLSFLQLHKNMTPFKTSIYFLASEEHVPMS